MTHPSRQICGIPAIAHSPSLYEVAMPSYRAEDILKALYVMFTEQGNWIISWLTSDGREIASYTKFPSRDAAFTHLAGRRTKLQDEVQV